MQRIKNKSLKDYKFIDLFCGIGGFHLALSSFGAKCVFASDIDVNAKKVYEDNFKIKVSGDITKIKESDIPEHDIICAGFPCQAFSISGKKGGFNDFKGRGELYKNVVEIAKYHQPKFILLENVKNLEAHNNGTTLKTILRDFEDVGYDMFFKVLNASDYGIPQARKRIYIVGIRRDLNIKEFSFPEPVKKKSFLKDILEIDIDRSSLLINRDDVKIDYNIEEKETGSLLRIGHVGLGRQGERIYSVQGHSITLSSQGGGVGGKTGMYLINGKVYKLSGRECARLMGFPDKYKIAETNNLCYCQFGNSVVVDVLQHILLKLVSLV
ncbi:MAG: DNA cytosine methyltransferase [Clostridiales bacterium]|nr:DNA cytosine methyltransferase [Clostridiales bacterium]